MFVGGARLGKATLVIIELDSWSLPGGGAAGHLHQCLRRRHPGRWQLRLRAAAFGGRSPKKALMLIKTRKVFRFSGDPKGI